MADPVDVIGRICDDGESDKLSRIATVLGMDKVEAQRDLYADALREIARKGVTTGYGRTALAHIARHALRAALGVTTHQSDTERLNWIARQGDDFSSGILQDCPGDGNYYVVGTNNARGTGKTFREALDSARGAKENSNV